MSDDGRGGDNDNGGGAETNYKTFVGGISWSMTDEQLLDGEKGTDRSGGR